MPSDIKILATTDDGCDAPGFTSAWHSLATTPGKTVVAAANPLPSGASSAALRLGDETAELSSAASDGCIRVRGATASLIVAAACNGVWGVPPDLVFVGVNDGPNVGTMGIHSGTLGAARTAHEFNVPSLGVSLDVYHSRLADYTEERFWDTAVEVSKILLEALLVSSRPGEPSCCVAVNVPNRPIEALRGVAIASLAEVRTSVAVTGGRIVEQFPCVRSAKPGSDVSMLRENYVTVTCLAELNCNHVRVCADAGSRVFA